MLEIFGPYNNVTCREGTLKKYLLRFYFIIELVWLICISMPNFSCLILRHQAKLWIDKQTWQNFKGLTMEPFKRDSYI